MCLNLASLRCRGFTLVELMIAIAVLAILAGIAIPAFDSFILSSRLRTYTNNFSANAQLAKSEAMKRNAVVTLCKSADGTSCTTSGGWEQGWIVLSGSTVIRRQLSVASGFLLSSSVSSLAFQPSGFGSTQATLIICRASPVGSQERTLTVSPTGRITITKTYAGICS